MTSKIDDTLREKLAELKQTHRALDDEISGLECSVRHDQLQFEPAEKA